jgi:hypothetical protein
MNTPFEIMNTKITNRYNTEESMVSIHKEQMKWVFKDIQNNPKCQFCEKSIIKYIYSDRQGELVCCSATCVDKYCYGNYE